MGQNTEEILMRVGLDTSGVSRGMVEMKHSLNEFATEWGTKLIGAFAVEKLFEFEKGIIEFAKNVSLTAERLNVTTVAAQQLSYAAALAGVDLEKVATSLDKLAKAKEAAIGGDNKQISAFKQFGVDIASIKSLSPEELFEKIGKSIGETGANAEVTASAMELMGKSAGKLIPMLAHYAETKNEAVIISDKDLANIKLAGEEIEGLEMRLKALAAQVTVRVFDANVWKRFWYSVTSGASFLDSQKMFPDLEKKVDLEKQVADQVKDQADSYEKITTELEKQIKSTNAFVALGTNINKLLTTIHGVNFVGASIEDIAGRDWVKQRKGLYGEGGAFDSGKGDGQLRLVAQDFIAAQEAQRYDRTRGWFFLADKAQARMNRDMDILKKYDAIPSNPGQDISAMRTQLDKMIGQLSNLAVTVKGTE